MRQAFRFRAVVTRLARLRATGGAAVACAVGASLLMAACAGMLERVPVPASDIYTASVPGLSHVRFWGDEAPQGADAALRVTLPSLHKPPQSQHSEGGRPVLNYLAISGGGSYGAFGAGLLVGWTRTGTRPTFEFVTGISAGALIAPFAFLGSAYDRQLEEIWTRYGDDDLVTKRPLAILFGASAAVDTQPLADLIAHYIDRPFLNAVAREYRKGRVLMIGTTNIDARRPVVWNMGEIALSSNPRALQLFRDVLLASASIPGIMPPIKINVEAGGAAYDEFHVDGGVTRQVFLKPTTLRWTDFDRYYPAPPLRRVYIIRNGRISPRYSPVGTGAASLAATSISALLDNQTSGDIYRIFVDSTSDGAEFRLAAEESALEPNGTALFDKTYMKALFAYARNRAAHGYPWLRTVPEAEPSHHH